jgi:hypothetical protein
MQRRGSEKLLIGFKATGTRKQRQPSFQKALVADSEKDDGTDSEPMHKYITSSVIW